MAFCRLPFLLQRLNLERCREAGGSLGLYFDHRDADPREDGSILKSFVSAATASSLLSSDGDALVIRLPGAESKDTICAQESVIALTELMLQQRNVVV